MRALIFLFLMPLVSGTDTKPIAPETTKVCFISLAPSTYTNRHDCMRAGFGIYLALQDLKTQENLPIELSYYDGSKLLDDAKQISKVLKEADLYLIGGSTYGQGPTFYVRRFFELGGATNMLGTKVAAWATAGGAHTGGEEVVLSIMRSMMGMGASSFSLAQKLMVFTTDERISPKPGEFSQLDMWYMDSFARMIAVKALDRGNREETRKLAKRLKIGPLYFLNTGTQTFPPAQAVLDGFEPRRQRLNTAADATSEAWKGLLALIKNPN
jgi:multimeric flavodoxin WrbA